jgi:DNA-binding NtrC family response regulator
MDSKGDILVVDDDAAVCEQLNALFVRDNYRVVAANAAEQAEQFLKNEDIDLVITDLRLPGMDGIELTRRIAAQWSDVPVIVMTGYAEIQNAVEVLKLGASDYIVKPFSMSAIQESVRLVLEKTRLFSEIRRLRRRYHNGKYESGRILSRTPEIQHVFDVIHRVAPTKGTVVVEGETGTGKELVARSIHDESLRSQGPFVTINCGGLPETLLESELFGYDRGAFTGATQPKPGKIELAHGGTLFLDEVENMPLTMQAKLLLVLNDHKVQRLGSGNWTAVDIRVIAASNVPLKDLLAQGKLRTDFYYRINVVTIKMLPLRGRLNDIPLLVQDFLRHHPDALNRKITGITPNALDHLMRYQWPGNIRELHNVLEKAVILAKSQVLDVGDLGLESVHGDARDRKEIVSTDISLEQWLREQEKRYLIQKLQAYRGRIDLTAKSSGVDVRTIHRKMQLYGLDKKKFDPKKLPPNTQAVAKSSGNY